MEGKYGENISHPIPGGIFDHGRRGLRKCLVGGEKAYFHGVFQYATPIEPSPMVGGQPGGQIAYPVAAVETLGGAMQTVRLGAVLFEDWAQEGG